MSDLKCVMSDCIGDLYLGITETYALTTEGQAKRDNSGWHTTSRWEVFCSEGHVLLLPLGCDDYERFDRDAWNRLASLAAEAAS
jgi:hypothetical protein